MLNLKKVKGTAPKKIKIQDDCQGLWKRKKNHVGLGPIYKYIGQRQQQKKVLAFTITKKQKQKNHISATSI